MPLHAYLGLLTDVGSDTVAPTEANGGSYVRQPISFGKAVYGVMRNTTPWTFGMGLPVQQTAGWALYYYASAQPPLLGQPPFLVLPFPAVRPAPGAGPIDHGDEGDLTITFPDLASWANGDGVHLNDGIVTSGLVYHRRNVRGVVTNADVAPPGMTLVPIGPHQFEVVHAAMWRGFNSQIALYFGGQWEGVP